MYIHVVADLYACVVFSYSIPGVLECDESSVHYLIAVAKTHSWFFEGTARSVTQPRTGILPLPASVMGQTPTEWQPIHD